MKVGTKLNSSTILFPVLTISFHSTAIRYKLIGKVNKHVQMEGVMVGSWNKLNQIYAFSDLYLYYDVSTAVSSLTEYNYIFSLILF